MSRRWIPAKTISPISFIISVKNVGFKFKEIVMLMENLKVIRLNYLDFLDHLDKTGIARPALKIPSFDPDLDGQLVHPGERAR